MLQTRKLNKKGVELSINVIIISALALIVLLIVTIVLMNRTAKFTHSLDSCKEKGGKCTTPDKCDGINLGNSFCENPDQVCCRPFYKEGGG